MMSDMTGPHRAGFRWLLAVALVGFTAVACTEVRPERDMEQGGVLESPTHEADSLHRAEEQEEQNR